MTVRRRGGALIWALLITTTFAIIPIAGVRADVGVAIDIGRMSIDQKLSKGGSYQLPTIGVRKLMQRWQAHHAAA